jgi:hypothetical protein
MRGRVLIFWLDAGHRRLSPFPILSRLGCAWAHSSPALSRTHGNGSL